MEVIILEAKTGKLVWQIPVQLSGLNYCPEDSEYFNLAWKCAVEDKLVEESRRSEFSFKLKR